MRFKPLRLALAAGTAFVAIVPAYAQDSGTGSANDIVVTARRTEERLQDVPISITVLNQQQLANKNIVTATDLATYTPSLSSNNNFGSDNTSFAIRGFVQDIGTAPSVGTYFADVVVPRGGSNGQPIGDNANPGDFFDLQNVQVLKGPQGTLFGRNTTGGAVLFVPQRPTDKFEGYVEGGLGNYGMHRGQAVINIPLSDTFKVRLGVDHMDRNGYIHNISGIGPNRFGDTNYTAARLSVVADLTPDISNYLVVSYNLSRNNGGINTLAAANPTQGLFGAFAYQQLLQQRADGRFYITENPLPRSRLRTEQFQIVDNLSWRVADNLTIRNIASYAQLKQTGQNPIFGERFVVPAGGALYDTAFQVSISPPGLRSADEETVTEELRLEGTSSKFNWQAGAYLEIANPLSDVGSQSPGFASCASNVVFGSTFQCTDPLGRLVSDELGFPPGSVHVGNINSTIGKTAFHDVGLYAQGTYSLTDHFKVTGGFRYTWDHETIDTEQKIYTLQTAPNVGVLGAPSCLNPFAVAPTCFTHYRTSSKAPTWLIDVDYTPTRDILIYAKYARGYRAATIAPNIPIGGTADNQDFGLNYVRAEKVDTYEVGIKSSFGGALHGTLNAAGFYNNFSNQQIQVGFLPFDTSKYPQTAAPVNAGKSKIYGAELEASIRPFTGLDLSVGYTYLRTRIDRVLDLPFNQAYQTQASFVEGDPLALSPRNKVTAAANYTLPFDDSFGRLTIGGSVTYRSRMLANYIDRSNPDPTIAALSYIKQLTLISANVNWRNVAGLPFDATFFATNLTKRKYYEFTPGLGSTQLGFDDATLGLPRMYGVSLRYKFGQ